jgi:hypothetical protein
VSAHAVRRAVDAFNRGDLDTYAAAFWPDAPRVVPGVPDALDADVLLESDNYVIAELTATDAAP